MSSGYPQTDEEVEAADHEQLAHWQRFLPSPANPDEVRRLNRLLARFKELGGWNATLSKKVGHDA